MIQILTKEWEITKEYIYEVALQESVIKHDQNIEIKWGLQSRKEFGYQRQVQLFAFGRETVEVKEIGCTDALQVWGTTFHGVEELMQYARSEQPKDGVWVGEDSERYPCFDSSDYATENRYYHNFVFASTRAELEDKLAMLEKRKLLKGNYNKLYPEMHPIAYWEGDTYHPLYYTVRDQDI